MVDVPNGWSLMEGAINNNIPGIVAECGGSCCCATCHVYIVDRDLGAPEEMEDEMLEEVMDERKPNSRLSCQIQVTDELEGLVVQIPELQD